MNYICCYQKWEKKAEVAKEEYKKALAEFNKKQRENGESSTSSKSKTIKESAKTSKSPKTTTSSPSKFKSKEFIESSDSSSDEDEVSLFIIKKSRFMNAAEMLFMSKEFYYFSRYSLKYKTIF